MEQDFLRLTQEAIEKTGFPFEERVARRFRDAGFEVKQSVYYIDGTTSELREVDILATCSANFKYSRHQDFSLFLEFSVVIECKYNDKQKSAWVVFARKGGLRNFFTNYVVSHEKDRTTASVLGTVVDLLSEGKEFSVLKIESVFGNQYKFFSLPQQRNAPPKTQSDNNKDKDQRDVVFRAIEKINSSVLYYDQESQSFLSETLEKKSSKKKHSHKNMYSGDYYSYRFSQMYIWRRR